MKDVDYYRDREQTYLKHFFLERYLERVAYVIGYSHREFVYVDGFSGPWKSDTEAFEDTSFTIATRKLAQVRDGLAGVGKQPRIRCLFVEKDPVAFRALETSIGSVRGLVVEARCGEFEELIPEILKFVGRSFSLVFIDPSGWTGFALQRITPILGHQPGEVVVNFMFDHINRFLDHPSREVARSYDELFGGPGWNEVVRAEGQRESRVVEFYRERMRKAGAFKYVTSTRILKPLADRSYFHLIYGTRHIRGLSEFRGVDKKVVEEQERVRLSAKQRHRIERTRQLEFFPAEAIAGPPTFNDERNSQLAAAAATLRRHLRNLRRLKFEDALGMLLEMPLVWESDVQKLIKEIREAGEIEVEGMKPRERTVKVGHTLVFKERSAGE